MSQALAALGEPREEGDVNLTWRNHLACGEVACADLVACAEQKTCTEHSLLSVQTRVLECKEYC